MYLITGATGNTGKPLTLALLNAGKKVRIISRDRVKAKELTDRGAELFLGSWSDASLLSSALKGTTAMYAMIPPDLFAPDYFVHQRKFAEAMATALMISNVKFVVSLSSVGTHLDSGTGALLGLRYMEQKLNEISGLNTLHLRAAYFMENMLGMIGLIKQYNKLGSPVSPDIRISMIAANDVGLYSAKMILALDFFGHNVQYLLGQRELTYNEITKVLGLAIGKPDIEYSRLSRQEYINALVNGLGVSVNVAENFYDNQNMINTGKIFEEARRDKESITQTSIEDFLKTFAYVYNMK